MGFFNGFPVGFVDFFIRLSLNNTIDKQTENILEYKKYITEPLNQLYSDLLPVVCDINDSLETKPARCISTPYTDRRFSPTVPLKEYIYLRFKQKGRKSDIAGLYFDMSASGYSYGLRIYKQTSSGFQSLKDYIAENPEPFEKELRMILKSGYKIIGEKYKKDHYPEISSIVLNDFLNRKSFYIARNRDLSNIVFSEKLSAEISDGFSNLKSILNLIQNAK